MLNVITVMGRLTSDPIAKTTQSGVAVTNFTLAVDSDYKHGDEKETSFIPVVTWRHTAEFVAKYFSKGKMAVVSGSLQTRNYEDKEGNKRTAFEIVAQNVYFADSKKDGAAPAGQSYSSQSGGFTEVDDPDDGTLPF